MAPVREWTGSPKDGWTGTSWAIPIDTLAMRPCARDEARASRIDVSGIAFGQCLMAAPESCAVKVSWILSRLRIGRCGESSSIIHTVNGSANPVLIRQSTNSGCSIIWVSSPNLMACAGFCCPSQKFDPRPFANCLTVRTIGIIEHRPLNSLQRARSARFEAKGAFLQEFIERPALEATSCRVLLLFCNE